MGFVEVETSALRDRVFVEVVTLTLHDRVFVEEDTSTLRDRGFVEVDALPRPVEVHEYPRLVEFDLHEHTKPSFRPCEDRIGTGLPLARTEVIYVAWNIGLFRARSTQKGDPASWGINSPAFKDRTHHSGLPPMRT